MKMILNGKELFSNHININSNTIRGNTKIPLIFFIIRNKIDKISPNLWYIKNEAILYLKINRNI